MASGDTKTEQMLNVLANGGDASQFSGCCNTKTQNYILGAIDRVQSVEDEVEELKNNPDVADIVATYADLMAYDKSKLTDKDIIRVLADETHDGDSTYYRYSTSSDDFTYIGESKQYTDFVGTDGQTAGTNGLVPAPATTDAGKFLKADGTWASVSDGIKTLTTADYNYPTNNPIGVATWKLETGIYKTAGSVTVYPHTATAITPSQYELLFVSGKNAYVYTLRYNGAQTMALFSADRTTGVGQGEGSIFSNSLVVDNLTSTSTNRPLSANQGKVLKDLIDGLIISGAGAPTTSTVGTVGQLYEDTTNGKLYQLTAIDNTDPNAPSYTWTEVGAGGGGDTVYSTKTTSSGADGGAVYIGGKNANQDIYSDPTVTDDHRHYFWALPLNADETAYTDVPGNETLNIGGSQADDSTNNVTVGFRSQSSGDNNVAIGYQAGNNMAYGSAVSVGASAQCLQNYGVALGREAMVSQGHTGSVALGYGAKTTRQGEVYVGTKDNFASYNSSKLRVIGGVHDGQLAQDAVTVAQVNATIDAINAALSTNIPHIGA